MEKSIFAMLAIVCLSTGVSTKYSVELQPLPEEGDFKAADTAYTKSGMEPLYDFARSFIHTSLPNEFPNEAIKFINEGSLDVKNLMSQVSGFVAAIGVGLLFFIIFPIGSCIFCCCRCCGARGAHNKHEFPESTKGIRIVLSCVLFIVATFALAGNICAYVSNDKVTTGVEEIKTRAINSLDDINTFLDLTEKQVIVLGHTNLNITWGAVINQMDITNLTATLSDYVREKMAGSAIAEMTPHIQNVHNVFAEVENAIDAFRTSTVSCGPCRTLDASMSSILSLKSNFSKFSEDEMNKQIADGIKTEVNSKLTSGTLKIENIKKEVHNLFSDMYHKVDNVVINIQKFRHDTQSGFNVDSLKRTIIDTFEHGIIPTVLKYRSIAGTVLSAILTLVISLLILGVIFGFIGNTSSSLPSGQGCVSHTGSILLMASVGLIFIFTPLVMLLTTGLFLIGAPLDKFACQGLDGPSYDSLKILEKLHIVENIGTKAELSYILRSCQEGKTAYVAFQLEDSTLTPGFNISEIKEKLEHQKKDINTQLNGTLNVISSIDANKMNPTSQLNALDTLKTSIEKVDVGSLKTKLDSLMMIPGLLPQATSKPLTDALDHLEALKNDIQTWKNGLFDSIRSAQRNLSSTTMEQIASNFTRDIFGIVDQYIDFAFDILENKLGKCTPLWNVYNSMLVVAFCKNTVDPFNGFWFSMGWCIFFFMPGLILAVKLEKYFRKMNSVGPSDH